MPEKNTTNLEFEPGSIAHNIEQDISRVALAHYSENTLETIARNMDPGHRKEIAQHLREIAEKFDL